MTRTFSTRAVPILTFFLIAFSQCFSQSDWNILKEAKALPSVNNKVTVKGFPFDKTLYISKDSLNQGFSITLQDPSYKVIFFRLVYDCEDCDIWETIIYGNRVTVNDAPILKRLKKNELLSFVLFKVEKNGKYFTVPEQNIIVTD